MTGGWSGISPFWAWSVPFLLGCPAPLAGLSSCWSGPWALYRSLGRSPCGGRNGRRGGGWLRWAVCAYSGGVAVAVADVLGHGGHLGSVLQFVLTSLALFLLAVGLAVLGWRTVGRRGWDALDAAITAIGAFLIVWVLYIDPALVRSTSAFAAFVATVVPAFSLLVFAMALKLAFGGAISTWSGRLLLLASGAALCASAFVYFKPWGSVVVPVGLTVAVVWLATLMLLGGAGIAADFVDVIGGHHRPAPDLPRWRLALFVVLATLAPLDVAVNVARGASETRLVEVLVPPICATLILLLLVFRLALIGRVAEARAGELAHQSATLAQALAEQDALQQTLAYRALHDPLTGVANRYVLTDRMDHLSGEPCRGQALMMLDLDGFKDINDTWGIPSATRSWLTWRIGW